MDGIFEEIEDTSPFIEDESPYRVVVLGFDTGTEAGTVQVAVTLETAQAAVDALRPLLLTGFPILLAAVGLIVWKLTGRALQPVESMREEAADVSAVALDRRLPVPQSQDEVHRLAVTLNSMLDRLESAAVSQRRFIADASHELKSPIAAMRTMLEVADQTPGFNDWDTLLSDLMAEDRRLEHLVSDLLTLARADERATPAHQEEIDLDQIVGIEAESAHARYPNITIDATRLVPMRMRGDRRALGRL
ncbi:MAG: HAMP domain-containing protein, partial [Anaerolineae bacterium]|nr:HAMP domain-containing protein [Anaerolineae bacterium]